MAGDEGTAAIMTKGLGLPQSDAEACLRLRNLTS